ncbi:hypothetical protein BDF14DRAFT_1817790 [Spinellus fusiger]|nr:hypothetical protein BDF14DRAFT_1817790 [Spinellus fusiger]
MCKYYWFFSFVLVFFCSHIEQNVISILKNNITSILNIRSLYNEYSLISKDNNINILKAECCPRILAIHTYWA